MRQNDLIIDLFAGGGGASVGIEMALGRQVDIAPEAIRMHRTNHPHTLHLTEDVFKDCPYLKVGERRRAPIMQYPETGQIAFA